MLGNKATKPVNIEAILSMSDSHLVLTFETPAAEVRTWLQNELTKRNTMPAEEYNEVVAKYHAEARKYLKDQIQTF